MGEAQVIRTDNPVARAFELAADDRFRSVSEIRRALEKEGYLNVALHFDSASLKKQLTTRIRSRDEASATLPDGPSGASSNADPGIPSGVDVLS